MWIKFYQFSDLTKDGTSESWSQFEKIFENHGYEIENTPEARYAFRGNNYITDLIVDLSGNNPNSDIVVKPLGFEKSKNDDKGKPITKILTSMSGKLIQNIY